MGAGSIDCRLTVCILGALPAPVAGPTLASVTARGYRVWLAVDKAPSGSTLIGGAIIVAAIPA